MAAGRASGSNMGQHSYQTIDYKDAGERYVVREPYLSEIKEEQKETRVIKVVLLLKTSAVARIILASHQNSMDKSSLSQKNRSVVKKTRFSIQMRAISCLSVGSFKQCF